MGLLIRICLEGGVDVEQSRDLMHAIKELIAVYGLHGSLELKEEIK